MEEYEFTINHELIDNCSKSLANCGWTLPGSLTVAETYQLISDTRDKSEVDNFFVEYYSEPNNLFRMINSVYSAELYDQWYKLIEQCITTFRNNLYLVTVPALLTVIEGAIIKISGENGSNRTKIIRLCLERVESINESFLKRHIWRSIYYFISILFEKKPFNMEQPQIINRHWILHGRDSNEWNKADCLRLFQALDTLVVAERSKPKRTLLWKFIKGDSNIR